MGVYVGGKKTALIKLTLVGLSAMLGLASPGSAMTAPEKDKPAARRSTEPKNSAERQETGKVQKLDGVRVYGVPDDQSVALLTAQEMAVQPRTTDTIEDLLRGFSFVSFDRRSRRSGSGAEVVAPQISIFGSRPYENSYTINGMSNNNHLNPGRWDSDDSSWYSVVPQGDSQSLMIDPSLLEAVMVFSENISAQYGDFTGGQVDAKIKDASLERWKGQVNARYTSDRLARQHFADPDRKNQQKEFKRYTAGAVLSGPLIKDRLGVLFGYTRSQGRTPVFTDFNERHSSRRTNQNVLLKVHTSPDNDFYAAGTLIYAPYEGVYYATDNRNGRHTVDGGGFNAMLNTQWVLGPGRWSNDLAYSDAQVSRHASTSVMYTWKTRPDGKPSRYANWTDSPIAGEGLMGDMEQTQRQLEFKSAYALDPVSLGPVRHALRWGGDFKHQHVKSYQTGYKNYTGPTPDSSVVGNVEDGVIAGEQYAKMIIAVNGGRRSRTVNHAAVFLEDTMDIGRVQLRPGVRVSWDDLTHNVDYAPRLKGQYDVFDNRRWVMNAGFNRYYGSQVINNALYFGGGNGYYKRVVSGQTHEVVTLPGRISGDTLRLFGQLKTPYADEITVGQTLRLNDEIAFKWQATRRAYRDQLQSARYRGDRQYDRIMTNNGRSDYKGLTMSLDARHDFGSWGEHAVSLGVTRAKTTGNSMNWTNAWQELGSSDDQIYLDGQKVSIYDMPAENFNPNWTVTLTHELGLLHQRLRVLTLCRYESRADRLVYQGRKDGLLAYATWRQAPLFNVDMDINYDLVKHGDTTVTLNAQLLNVFDRSTKVYVGERTSATPVNTMGRQIFVGIKAAF